MINNVKINLYYQILKANIFSPPHLRVMLNFIHSFIEYKKKKTELNSFPTSTVLYINKNCNYSCGFCYNKEILNENSLAEELYSTDDLLKFLASPYGKKVLRIALMGGEPFMNGNIYEIIKLCKRDRKIVNIVSNGSLIKSSDIQKIKDSKLDVIGLSLYDNNVDHIIRLAAEFNKAKINFWVQTVVDATDLGAIEKKLEFACENKIKNFILSNYNPYFDDQTQRSLYSTDQDFKKYMNKLKRIYSKRVNVIWPTLLVKGNNTTPKKCTLPFNYIHLDKDGVIAPCCYRFPKEQYGNLYSKEGWNSEYNINLRKNMLSFEEPIDECSNCENLYRNLYF